MANMSYCRFENTLQDLADCYEAIDEPLDSEREIKARKRLISMCVEIALEHGYEVGKPCSADDGDPRVP